MTRPRPITTSDTLDLLEAYRQGARYLRDRENAAGLGKRKPKVVESLPGNKRCLFSKDSAGKQIARQLADKFGVDEKTVQVNAKFAEAVELIAINCRQTATKVISLSGHPPNRKAIMELSRTSDIRQRYRVDGVIAGRFNALKIASDDPVFDTVSFSEVPSRLRRARGAILACQRSLNALVPKSVAAECEVLATICCNAARRLRQLVSRRSPNAVVVPKSLSREIVQPILSRRDVRGMIVGRARLALKLTIKNVWDFPEMLRRGITADDDQLIQTLQELRRIIEAADAVIQLAKSGRDAK